MITLAGKEASDWLSPVLVKEMRQGLKSRAFVGVFLALHAAMLVGFAVALAESSPDTMRRTSTGLFWLVAVGGLLGLVPALGLNAVQSEHKGQTFELLVLTRLSAWRIVWGKWTCITAQGLLVASSLLPYLVARYFLGGVALLFELAALLGVTLLCGFFVAFAVLASTFATTFSRATAIVVPAGLFVFALGAVSSRVVGPGGAPTPSPADNGLQLLAALLAAAIVALYLLRAAAARLAPSAENHAAPRRLLALSLFGLLWLPLPPSQLETTARLLVPVLLLMALDGCAGAPPSSPSAYRPYARAPGPLRWLAVLTYPGWPSGLVFAGALAGAISATLLVAGDAAAEDAALAGLGFFACVGLAVAAARTPRRFGAVGQIGLLVHALLLLVSVLGYEALRATAPLSLASVRWLGTASPVAALWGATIGEVDSEARAGSAVCMAAWIGLAAVLLMWRGRADLGVAAVAVRRARGRGA